MHDFSPKELKNYLDKANPRPLLLDVREPWEFDTVHLPDSKLIPLAQLPAQLESLDRQRDLVVICHHGIRSRRAALWLEQQGFDKVINLRGGIDAWAREIDPSLGTYT